MKEIWWSICRYKQGNPSVKFFTSEELALWHQDHLEKKWTSAGDVIGSFKVWKMEPKPENEIDYFLYLWDNSLPNKELKKYLNQFFPDVLPKFRIEIPVTNPGQYDYVNVYYTKENGKEILSPYTMVTTDTAKEIEKNLNDTYEWLNENA